MKNEKGGGVVWERGGSATWGQGVERVDVLEDEVPQRVGERISKGDQIAKRITSQNAALKHNRPHYPKKIIMVSGVCEYDIGCNTATML